MRRPRMATGPFASETPRRGGTVSSYFSSVVAIALVLLEAVGSRFPARRRLHACGFAALTLAVPATAAAAPFGELPFREVPSAAVCVRATGVPGELLRWSRGGFTLMQARADGLQDVGAVSLGTLAACPAVAADAATGAAVVAGTDRGVIRVVQRAPGGRWAAPATIRTTSFTDPDVAVSARGDAVLTWAEYGPNGRSARIRAARRPAGASGWTVETLSPYRRVTFETVTVGMTAAGEALALLGVETADTSGKGYVALATAAPGAGSAPLRRIATTRFGDEPALAVAPGGRALIAVAGFNDLSVYERPPGGAFDKGVSLFDGSVSTLR